MLEKWPKHLAAFTLGVLFTLLLLELVLQFLPVSKGAYGAEPDSEWPPHHLIPNIGYTFSAGWDLENVRHGRINNLGFVSPFDYRPGTAGVFVVGDSFIENMMNDYSSGLQGSLPSFLRTPQPVLGFGVSGGSLANDLGVSELIARRFKPDWVVVLVTRGNFIGGFNLLPGYFRWKSGSSPGIELIAERRHGKLALFVRNLALVRYVRGNLRGDLGNIFANRSNETPKGCRRIALSRPDEALVGYMVDKLPGIYGLPPSRVVLVFDADRETIYNPQLYGTAGLCPTRDALGRRLLARAASERGIGVIDMDPVFRAHYRQTAEHFDYLPVDAHWNGVAHILAAQEVARYINSRDKN